MFEKLFSTLESWRLKIRIFFIQRLVSTLLGPLSLWMEHSAEDARTLTIGDWWNSHLLFINIVAWLEEILTASSIRLSIQLLKVLRTTIKNVCFTPSCSSSQCFHSGEAYFCLSIPSCAQMYERGKEGGGTVNQQVDITLGEICNLIGPNICGKRPERTAL